MKTIIGFIAIVLSVFLFTPSNVIDIDKELHVPDFKLIETNYIPSVEVIESRRKIDEYQRKIQANLTYLKSNVENTKTNKATGRPIPNYGSAYSSK